jgi:demethylmenaquinone methyltransferase/2-methoxy-6-polyprenyl-1,4-benzoquinol methylase
MQETAAGPRDSVAGGGRKLYLSVRMPTVDLEKTEARAAAAGGAEKRAYVRRVFSEIAPRYDLLNHLLSFNIDRGWRRRAIAALDPLRNPTGVYVDLCAGTLDVASELSQTRGFRGLVLGTDFAEPMLRAGSNKAPRVLVAPVTADALKLPVADDTAAGAIVAFGIRNVASLPAALAEAYRVLEPGGRFVILEFSTPRSRVVRGVYHAYFHAVLPAVGRIVSRHPTAYRYLPESVARFPTQEELARAMRDAGFVNVRWESLTMGIAAIHAGDKPGRPPT